MAPNQKAARVVEKISRIYELVGEINDLVSELHGLNVSMRIRAESCQHDPLAKAAVIEFGMATNFEPTGRY